MPENGAEDWALDIHGKVALHLAAESGHEAVVGADAKVKEIILIIRHCTWQLGMGMRRWCGCYWRRELTLTRRAREE